MLSSFDNFDHSIFLFIRWNCISTKYSRPNCIRWNCIRWNWPESSFYVSKIVKYALVILGFHSELSGLSTYPSILSFDHYSARSLLFPSPLSLFLSFAFFLSPFHSLTHSVCLSVSLSFFLSICLWVCLSVFFFFCFVWRSMVYVGDHIRHFNWLCVSISWLQRI